MRTTYDVTLTTKQLDTLKQKLKTDSTPFYFDILYLEVVMAWYKMLGLEEASTKEISEPSFIKEQMEKNAAVKEKNAALYLCTGGDPVTCINTGIEQICQLCGYFGIK